MTKCNRPTLDVTISPDGNFRICCYGTTLGNIEGQTIREFFNSDAVKEISNTLNSGTRHSYCSACWNIEDRGHDKNRPELGWWRWATRYGWRPYDWYVALRPKRRQLAQNEPSAMEE